MIEDIKIHIETGQSYKYINFSYIRWDINAHGNLFYFIERCSFINKYCKIVCVDQPQFFTI